MGFRDLGAVEWVVVTVVVFAGVVEWTHISACGEKIAGSKNHKEVSAESRIK